MKGYYTDEYGDEFECEVLACGISGRWTNKTYIYMPEFDETGWCSSHLVWCE